MKFSFLIYLSLSLWERVRVRGPLTLILSPEGRGN